MKFDNKLIKLYSTIGHRATFGMVVVELVKKYSDLMVLTADVSTSAGLDRFKKNYENNYIDVGIAEQNLINVATGIANEGFKVITTTFSPFQTLRCCEQIKVNLGYGNEKVCMVGLASGLALGHLGFTHCSIEDIGVLRSIPNIAIVSPSDCFELAKCVEAAINYKDSVYIRLTGNTNIPIINDKEYNFEIGKSITLREGSEILIIGNGSTVKTALELNELLKIEKISSEVINMHTIKPLDLSTLKKSIFKKKLVITIEEHNIIGGLGSAIAEYLSSTRNSPRQLFFGINDKYIKGGSYKYLINNYNLNIDHIFKEVLNEFRNI